MIDNHLPLENHILRGDQEQAGYERKAIGQLALSPPSSPTWPLLACSVLSAQCSALSAQPLGRAVTLIVSTYGALGHRNASLLYLLQAIIMLAQGNVRNVEFD